MKVIFNLASEDGGDIQKYNGLRKKEKEYKIGNHFKKKEIPKTNAIG